ncbi:MAG: O-antigen ligase [Paracoccaceae bacterium]
MKSPDIHQRPVFAALAIGLTIMPLAFGGTTAWFTNLFAVYIGIIAAIWSIAETTGPTPLPSDTRPILVPTALVSIAVLWCFAQAWLSAPPGIAHSAWSEATSLLGTPALHPAISVNPEASVAGAVRLTGYGLVFMLCYQFAAVERRAARLLALITAAGSAFALYGIGLELSGSGYVLWYERDFEPGNLSSTFPNRNAFADYAALCLICGCALLYRRTLRHEDLSRGWQRATVAVSLFYLRRNGWLIYASAILFAAILMTHSRGGLIVAVVALIAFAACAAGSALNRRPSLIGAIGIAVSAGTLFGIAGGDTSDRFAKIEAASFERIEIFRLTVDAIGDRPVLGTGLGTFSDIFAAYRTEALLPQIDFAHNSYLENAMEMGVPAATTFYAGLMVLFIFFARSLRHNRHAHPYPALGIAAMTVAFFHSLFDYADQFPAVAITLAAILGIAAAQSFKVQPAGPAFSGDDRRQV